MTVQSWKLGLCPLWNHESALFVVNTCRYFLPWNTARALNSSFWSRYGGSLLFVWSITSSFTLAGSPQKKVNVSDAPSRLFLPPLPNMSIVLTL